jgi:hypothetical protein
LPSIPPLCASLNSSSKNPYSIHLLELIGLDCGKESAIDIATFFITKTISQDHHLTIRLYYHFCSFFQSSFDSFHKYVFLSKKKKNKNKKTKNKK